MSKLRLILTAVFLPVLLGCPLGTPNDHDRPHGHQDTTFDVSADDDTIVFNAAGSGGRDLYVLRLSDLKITRIAETDDYEVAPAFSPDGGTIAYAAGVPGDKADHIFTMSVDGAGRKQLTKAEGNDTAPEFSSDGSMIVFARDKTYVWGGLAANWDNGGVICVVNADGTRERQLTPDEVFAFEPHFSTDGKAVIYSTESGLFSVAVAGDKPAIRLGPGGTHVDLSSDGNRIVFADGRYSPDYEIFVSRVDGSERTQVTKCDEGCFHPVFTNKDDGIYYLMETWPDGPTGHPKSSLWWTTLDGQQRKQIADLSLFDDPLAWTP